MVGYFVYVSLVRVVKFVCRPESYALVEASDTSECNKAAQRGPTEDSPWSNGI